MVYKTFKNRTMMLEYFQSFHKDILTSWRLYLWDDFFIMKDTFHLILILFFFLFHVVYKFGNFLAYPQGLKSGILFDFEITRFKLLISYSRYPTTLLLVNVRHGSPMCKNAEHPLENTHTVEMNLHKKTSKRVEIHFPTLIPQIKHQYFYSTIHGYNFGHQLLLLQREFGHFWHEFTMHFMQLLMGLQTAIVETLPLEVRDITFQHLLIMAIQFYQ